MKPKSPNRFTLVRLEIRGIIFLGGGGGGGGGGGRRGGDSNTQEGGPSSPFGTPRCTVQDCNWVWSYDFLLGKKTMEANALRVQAAQPSVVRVDLWYETAFNGMRSFWAIWRVFTRKSVLDGPKGRARVSLWMPRLSLRGTLKDRRFSPPQRVCSLSVYFISASMHITSSPHGLAFVSD